VRSAKPTCRVVRGTRAPVFADPLPPEPIHIAVGSRDAIAFAMTRALIFAPGLEDAAWVESELADRRLTMRRVPTVREVVVTLVDDPPPRTQLLVIDVDAMDAIEVLRLHAVREHGWFGAIVGLGQVPEPLRVSLGIERRFARPFVQGALRRAVAQIGLDRATTRMPKLERQR
jgi:hypothetical protein